MPFFLVKGDITTMKVDAIVNAANRSLLGGGGVDGAIHRAAGPGLLMECRTLGGCATGEAKITKGYRLPANYVIHTVGPVWQGGNCNERELLIQAYRSSLELAAENGCRTVAFPLISSGVYGYPKDEALRVATDTVEDFLRSCDMTVFLVIFQASDYDIGRALFDDISAEVACCKTERPAPEHGLDGGCTGPCPSGDAFCRMLLQRLAASGMSHDLFCQKANLTKELFASFSCAPCPRPSKPVAMACAVALELPEGDIAALLAAAGYGFSDTPVFDRIVRYFISRGVYRIVEINKALFAFGEPQLGG